MKNAPSQELYQSLQTAYDHFNDSLFNSQLPPVIFTVQRQKGVLGYFAANRWASTDGSHAHEIAINPSHMGDSLVIDVMQTLVHEMAHCWQHCFGKPSRPSYHNSEWAYKMIDIGLQPTSTGEPGGSIVGQSMSDYPIKGGAFLKACFTLLDNSEFCIPWIDRRITNRSEASQQALNSTSIAVINEINSEDGEHSRVSSLTKKYNEVLPKETFIYPSPTTTEKSKSRYHCFKCDISVWGRPHLSIFCGHCGDQFKQN